MKKLFVGFCWVFLSVVSVRAETFTIDPVHSNVSFRVSHLVVSKVSGNFERFEGSFNYDPENPKAWKANASIDATGIDTRNEDRDKHLRNPDFLDVEKCPQIVFESSRVTGVKGRKAKLHGNLTLHCVTKPVVLDLDIGGIVKDPWGNTRAGFSATTKISRKDFGITWSKVLESGGLVVGDEVDIFIEVEGIAKKN